MKGKEGFRMISDEGIKFFNLNGLVTEVHPEVYNPAEDTFQLLETIQIKKDEMVLELGTGCGVIALECTRRGADVICTDINPHAVQLTYRNIQRNQRLLQGNIEVRQGDLFSAIKDDERFDVIIFNPPYLPTSPEERVGGNGWFDIATDGGVNGLAVIQRFIQGISMYLQRSGRAYFIFSSLADRSQLKRTFAAAKLKAKVVSRRQYEAETLDVYGLYRLENDQNMRKL
jgi:release factor glutamine methyltransferase